MKHIAEIMRMKRHRKSDDGQLVTVAKDAKAAGVTRHIGHRLAAEGRIPSIMFGTREYTVQGSIKAVIVADMKGKR
jgi:hypothetical protein